MRLENDSFRSSGVTLPGADASAAAAAAGARPHKEASNVLLVDGERSATGTPIMVGGPQIGYNYPGLTMEIGLYGPTLRARGATSVPFPGYMLIGRGEDFAWTLTSAGADIIDTYAERLCGGSRTRYVYKGKCRKMKTVNAGTISRGDDSVKVRYRQTVHGPVVGYARVAGSKRRVALSQKRSSMGRETTDQIFFQRLSTGRVKSAQDFVRAAAATPQTFNSFYADDTDIAFVTTGRLPNRRKGVNPDLPVDGRGKFEWKGFLKASKHPQDVSPSNGLLVNWNNKPAKDFPAGDERWDEGGTQRVDWLLAELAQAAEAHAGLRARRRERGRDRRPARPDVAGDQGGARPGHVAEPARDRGGGPDHGVVGRRRELGRRRPRRLHRRAGPDGDGGGLASRSPRRRCAAGSARTSARRCARGSRPFQSPPSGMYGGWHQYISKDLRTLLGQSVKGKFKVRYCGRGERASAVRRTCGRRSRPAPPRPRRAQGPATRRRGRTPTVKISFAPLPLVDMQYTNRPSGIHQVMQFAP